MNIPFPVPCGRPRSFGELKLYDHLFIKSDIRLDNPWGFMQAFWQIIFLIFKLVKQIIANEIDLIFLFEHMSKSN